MNKTIFELSFIIIIVSIISAIMSEVLNKSLGLRITLYDYYLFTSFLILFILILYFFPKSNEVKKK